MWKYTKVCVNPRRGNTRFHMWKFTRDRVLPHVEIHQKLWISQNAEIHIFWCISTCGNSSGKVNFRMSVYKRICEFPRGKTRGNTRFFADFRMRKYTRICEFPRAEIHAERCITACGNTLNQVQKNSSYCICLHFFRFTIGWPSFLRMSEQLPGCSLINKETLSLMIRCNVDAPSLLRD